MAVSVLEQPGHLCAAKWTSCLLLLPFQGAQRGPWSSAVVEKQGAAQFFGAGCVLRIPLLLLFLESKSKHSTFLLGRGEPRDTPLKDPWAQQRVTETFRRDPGLCHQPMPTLPVVTQALVMWPNGPSASGRGSPLLCITFSLANVFFLQGSIETLPFPQAAVWVPCLHLCAQLAPNYPDPCSSLQMGIGWG